MSDNYIFGCSSCSGKNGRDHVVWNILVGTGQSGSFSRDDEILDHIQDYSVRKMTEVYLDLGYSLYRSEHFGFRIYLCPGCNQFHERFFFLMHKGDHVITPAYSCSNRDRYPLRPVNLWTQGGRLYVKDDQGHRISWSCPLCGGDDLFGDKQLTLA